MSHQLYMYTAERRHIIERHDFYVDQIKKRLFLSFQNIDGEADAHANEVFHQMGRYASEYDDPTIYAEAAYEAAIEHVQLLADLHNQVILGALAGVYHQWDKELRKFMVRELRHTCPDEIADSMWKPNIGELFDLLKKFGWDCRTSDFFAALDASRLIVNVYKHGKGKALEDLAKKYPEYLLGCDSQHNPHSCLDHDLLTVSEEQFEQLADAVRRFWEAFPENSYYEGKESDK